MTDVSIEQSSELLPEDEFDDDDVGDTNFEEEEEDDYDDDESDYESKHKRRKKPNDVKPPVVQTKTAKPVKPKKRTTRDQLLSLINIKRK